MIKKHNLQIGLAFLLIGNLPSVFSNPQFQNEAKFLNNINYEEAKCNAKKVFSNNCLNSINNYQPKDRN